MDKKATAKSDTLSSQVLEYFRNYSGDQNLSSYLRGIVPQGESKVRKEADVNKPVDNKDLTLRDVKEKIDLTIEKEGNTSPTSSLTSNRKLEWDNGADIGYENSNRANLHKSFSLPTLTTLERIELGKKPLKSSLEGNVESCAQIYYPTSDSSCDSSPKPYVSTTTSYSHEEQKLDTTTSSSFAFKPWTNDIPPDSKLDKDDAIKFLYKKVGSPVAQSTPNIQHFPYKRSVSVDTPFSSEEREWISSISSKNNDNNKIMVTELKCVAKFTKSKIVKLAVTKPITIDCVNYKQYDDKVIQTMKSTEFESVGVQTETAKNTDMIGSIDHYNTNFDNADKQTVEYIKYSDSSDRPSSRSLGTNTASDLLSNCNSFEYLDPVNVDSVKPEKSDLEDCNPQRAYFSDNQSDLHKVSSESPSSNEVKSEKTLSSNITEASSKRTPLGDMISCNLSNHLNVDIEKSITLLQRLLKSKRYNRVTKQYFVKKIVEKIVKSNYSSDSSSTNRDEGEQKPAPFDFHHTKGGSSTSSKVSEKLLEPSLKTRLQENVPWVPACFNKDSTKSKKLEIKTFSADIFPENKQNRKVKDSRFTITSSICDQQEHKNLNLPLYFEPLTTNMPLSSSTHHLIENINKPQKATAKTWRDDITRSEAQFLKADGDKNDTLVKFAINERETQLNWINGEISHLNKLKNLLQENNNLENASTKTKKPNIKIEVLTKPHVEDMKKLKKSAAVYVITTDKTTSDSNVNQKNLETDPSMKEENTQGVEKEYLPDVKTFKFTTTAPDMKEAKLISSEIYKSDKPYTCIRRYVFEIPVQCSCDTFPCKHETVYRGIGTDPPVQPDDKTRKEPISKQPKMVKDSLPPTEKDTDEISHKASVTEQGTQSESIRRMNPSDFEFSDGKRKVHSVAQVPNLPLATENITGFRKAPVPFPNTSKSEELGTIFLNEPKESNVTLVERKLRQVYPATASDSDYRGTSTGAFIRQDDRGTEKDMNMPSVTDQKPTSRSPIDQDDHDRFDRGIQTSESEFSDRKRRVHSVAKVPYLPLTTKYTGALESPLSAFPTTSKSEELGATFLNDGKDSTATLMPTNVERRSKHVSVDFQDAKYPLIQFPGFSQHSVPESVQVQEPPKYDPNTQIPLADSHKTSSDNKVHMSAYRRPSIIYRKRSADFQNPIEYQKTSAEEDKPSGRDQQPSDDHRKLPIDYQSHSIDDQKISKQQKSADEPERQISLTDYQKYYANDQQPPDYEKSFADNQRAATQCKKHTIDNEKRTADSQITSADYKNYQKSVDQMKSLSENQISFVDHRKHSPGDERHPEYRRPADYEEIPADQQRPLDDYQKPTANGQTPSNYYQKHISDQRSPYDYQNNFPSSHRPLDYHGPPTDNERPPSDYQKSAAAQQRPASDYQKTVDDKTPSTYHHGRFPGSKSSTHQLSTDDNQFFADRQSRNLDPLISSKHQGHTTEYHRPLTGDNRPFIDSQRDLPDPPRSTMHQGPSVEHEKPADYQRRLPDPSRSSKHQEPIADDQRPTDSQRNFLPVPQRSAEHHEISGDQERLPADYQQSSAGYHKPADHQKRSTDDQIPSSDHQKPLAGLQKSAEHQGPSVDYEMPPADYQRRLPGTSRSAKHQERIADDQRPTDSQRNFLPVPQKSTEHHEFSGDQERLPVNYQQPSAGYHKPADYQKRSTDDQIPYSDNQRRLAGLQKFAEHHGPSVDYEIPPPDYQKSSAGPRRSEYQDRTVDYQRFSADDPGLPSEHQRSYPDSQRPSKHADPSPSYQQSSTDQKRFADPRISSEHQALSSDSQRRFPGSQRSANYQEPSADSEYVKVSIDHKNIPADKKRPPTDYPESFADPRRPEHQEPAAHHEKLSVDDQGFSIEGQRRYPDPQRSSKHAEPADYQQSSTNGHTSSSDQKHVSDPGISFEHRGLSTDPQWRFLDPQRSAQYQEPSADYERPAGYKQSSSNQQRPPADDHIPKRHYPAPQRSAEYQGPLPDYKPHSTNYHPSSVPQHIPSGYQRPADERRLSPDFQKPLGGLRKSADDQGPSTDHGISSTNPKPGTGPQRFFTDQRSQYQDLPTDYEKPPTADDHISSIDPQRHYSRSQRSAEYQRPYTNEAPAAAKYKGSTTQQRPVDYQKQPADQRPAGDYQGRSQRSQDQDSTTDEQVSSADYPRPSTDDQIPSIDSQRHFPRPQRPEYQGPSADFETVPKTHPEFTDQQNLRDYRKHPDSQRPIGRQKDFYDSRIPLHQGSTSDYQRFSADDQILSVDAQRHSSGPQKSSSQQGFRGPEKPEDRGPTAGYKTFPSEFKKPSTEDQRLLVNGQGTSADDQRPSDEDRIPPIAPQRRFPITRSFPDYQSSFSGFEKRPTSHQEPPIEGWVRATGYQKDFSEPLRSDYQADYEITPTDHIASAEQQRSSADYQRSSADDQIPSVDSQRRFPGRQKYVQHQESTDYGGIPIGQKFPTQLKRTDVQRPVASYHRDFSDGQRPQIRDSTADYETHIHHKKSTDQHKPVADYKRPSTADQILSIDSEKRFPESQRPNEYQEKKRYKKISPSEQRRPFAEYQEPPVGYEESTDYQRPSDYLTPHDDQRPLLTSTSRDSSDKQKSRVYQESPIGHEEPASDYQRSSNDYQRSAVDYQKPSIDYGRRSLNQHKPSSKRPAGHEKSSADHHKPSADRQKPFSDYQQHATEQERISEYERPVAYEKSSTHRQKSPMDYQKSSEYQRPLEDQQKFSDYQRPSTGEGQRSSSDHQQASIGRKHSPDRRKSSPEYQRPSGDYQRPPLIHKRPSTDYREPSLSGQKSPDYQSPSVDYQRPSPEYQRSSTDHQSFTPKYQKATSDNQTSTHEFQGAKDYEGDASDYQALPNPEYEKSGDAKYPRSQPVQKKYASSTSSTSSTSTASGSQTILIRICPCCKRKKSKYGSILQGLPNEIENSMCRLCHMHTSMTVNPRTGQYNVYPDHVCNCYTLLKTETVNKIKQTVKQLEQLENEEAYCKCPYKKCTCPASGRLRKGIAYTLTLEDDDASEFSEREIGRLKSLDEIKLKVPGRKKHKKKKHNRKHHGKQKKDKSPSRVTLQEYLCINRPTFVQNAEERRKTLIELAYMREQRCQKYKHLLAMTTGALPDGSEDKNKKKRLYSSKEMRTITAKNYKKLPEVQRKLKEQRDKNTKKANKLLADIFNKKIQQNALKGNVDLSTTASVIKFI